MSVQSHGRFDFYEPDCDPITPADYGWVLESEVPHIEICRDQLLRIVEAVYVTGDIDSLESSLEDVLGQFDLSMPGKTPVIQKKLTHE